MAVLLDALVIAMVSASVAFSQYAFGYDTGSFAIDLTTSVRCRVNSLSSLNDCGFPRNCEASGTGAAFATCELTHINPCSN